mmetsp:Transcript_33320/g.38796  ORF Transcript_33320/g.38796 Transcript_33320/m.38796 type:complete len:267 (-) Transcript_33320:253-1053(-)
MSLNSMSTADYRRNVERRKIQAEKYLAEHRIRWMLEQVTSELVLLTPNEPLHYMMTRLPDLAAKQQQQQQAQKNGGEQLATMDIQRPRLICVLGGPASGKAVQCALLGEEAGMTIVAPSELIREEIKFGTDVGKKLGEMLHRGETVPTDIVTELVKKHVKDPKGSYVFDGYPRTLEQCLALETHVAEISLAIFLDCSESTMVSRMHDRQGGEDDREPLRSKKLDAFFLETLPVVEYLKAVGKLVAVDAEGAKQETIRQVQSVLNQQ